MCFLPVFTLLLRASFRSNELKLYLENNFANGLPDTNLTFCFSDIVIQFRINLGFRNYDKVIILENVSHLPG